MSTSEQPIDSRHKGRHRAGSVQEAGRIGSGLVTMVHDGSLFYVQLFVGHHTRDKKCPDSAVSVLGEGSRMVPSPMPKRDHSDPQTFRPRSEGEGKLVRAEGLEPSRALRPNGFSRPSTAFAAPAVRVWGLDYPFTVSRMYFPVFRCCPSSLYTFPTGPDFSGQGLARDRHVKGFPEFEQFCIAGFPASTQVSRLSPMRLPIPPRPHGFKGSMKQRPTRSDF